MDEDYVWWPPEITLFQSDVTLRTHVSSLSNLISCLQGQQRKIGGYYYIALVRDLLPPWEGVGGGCWRHPTIVRVYKNGRSSGFIPKPPWETSAVHPTPVIKGKTADLPILLLKSKVWLFSSLLFSLLTSLSLSDEQGIWNLLHVAHLLRGSVWDHWLRHCSKFTLFDVLSDKRQSIAQNERKHNSYSTIRRHGGIRLAGFEEE